MTPKFKIGDKVVVKKVFTITEIMPYGKGIQYDTDLDYTLNEEDIILVDSEKNKLTELKRDVKRYFELEGNYQKSSHEYHEMEYIKNKLMKVGTEE